MAMYGRVFASIYNQRWAGFAGQFAPLIEALYAGTPTGQANRTLLDLCCGSGQLVRYFLEKGYRVVGLDQSEDMLVYARENAAPYLASGQARFVCGDAAGFCLPDGEKFGLATATFDALNHLPDVDALAACFRAVCAAVLEGGYFIFDLNTRAGLRRWNSISVEDSADLVLINRGIFDEERDRAWVRISGFIQLADGRYERFEETMFNTAFDMACVRQMLLDTGWRSAYGARGSDLSTPLSDPEAVGRVFFVAQK